MHTHAIDKHIIVSSQNVSGLYAVLDMLLTFDCLTFDARGCIIYV